MNFSMNKIQKINAKIKLKIIGINVLLFIILVSLITLNKTLIRPYVTNSFMVIITGSIPNFLAAYLISLFVVNPVNILKPKLGRQIVYTSSLIISSILTVEEFKSIWGASKVYDKFDIIGSIIGSLLAILTYEIILKRQRRKQLIIKHI